MAEPEPETIAELSELLDDMEALAPVRPRLAETRVIYRPAESDDPIDDSLPDEEIDDSGDFSDSSSPQQGASIPPVVDFQPTLLGGPIAAVDCGIVRLGETENGLVIALRASIVINDESSVRIQLYRTGPLYLHNAHKAQTLYLMGKHLGKADFFVELDGSDPPDFTRSKVKSGVANDAHQYGDRFRNWFERLIQRIGMTSIENGVVLVDGALTLRTRDTPHTYLQGLANLADEHGNAIIAISKQSLLQVGGKSIRFWLNDAPNRLCYRPLISVMRHEGAEERSLGNIYVARFSALGPTLRMDVKPIRGQSDDEAIGQLYTSIQVRGGYPDILVQAHAHSYFTPPDVIQLQAQASAKFSLTPQADVELTGIFGPFGGRFK